MSPSQPSKSSVKGAAPTKASQGSQRPQKPRVRSVLIEPRDNEPPRVSVSVSYEKSAPTMKQLKKAVMEVIRDVAASAGGEPTLVDLGYKESQTRRILTQTFERREKGEGGG